MRSRSARSLLNRIRKGPRLHGSTGASLSAFLVLLMPLFLLILSTAVDGLMLVAAQRRAITMASIGAQAGAARLDFDGTAPVLAGDACAVAQQAACENVEGGCGVAWPSVSCRQSARSLTVDVRLRAPHLLKGAYRLGASEVRVSVEGGPGYGINTRE